VEKEKWHLLAYKSAMIKVFVNNNENFQVWNGDDMMGQQIILKNIYVEELNSMQPLCK
jgi:hypothetical protein